MPYRKTYGKSRKRNMQTRKRTTKRSYRSSSAKFIRNVVNNTIMEKKRHQLDYPNQAVGASLHFQNLFDITQHTIGSGVPEPQWYRMGTQIHCTGLSFKMQITSASSSYPNRLRFLLYVPKYDEADTHPNLNMYANPDYEKFRVLRDFSINVPLNTNTTAIKIVKVAVKLNRKLHFSGVNGNTLQSKVPKLMVCAASTAAGTLLSGQANAWYTDA